MVFRKLSQKRHWDGLPWLGSQEIQADAVRCLMTRQNRLSVFVLDRADDQTARVVAALAVTRDSLAHLDLAIAPEEVLARCDIRRDKVQGQTPDPGVNDWHEDLVELTAGQIARLATAIKSEGEIRRYNLKKVGAAIQQSLDEDFIGAEQINVNLVPSLRKRGIIRSFPAGTRRS